VANNVEPCGHWKSSYKEVVRDVEEREKIKSRRPLWSINRQAYSSSRGSYLTEFADSMGAHGHKPRNILGFESTK